MLENYLSADTKAMLGLKDRPEPVLKLTKKGIKYKYYTNYNAITNGVNHLNIIIIEATKKIDGESRTEYFIGTYEQVFENHGPGEHISLFFNHIEEFKDKNYLITPENLEETVVSTMKNFFNKNIAALP